MHESRDGSIDALRIGALAACIAVHAAVPYVSAPVSELVWPVRAASSSWIADLVFWWGRCAQPQLFFLLAGMVSAQLLDARGPTAFATARLRRIGVPFLSGVAFVLPVVGAIWAWGWLDAGRVSWAEIRSWRFIDPEIARNSLGPAHLWFLEDLLIVSLIFAAWGRVSARWGARAIASSGTTLAGLALISWTILLLRPDVVFAVRNTFVPDVARIAFGATFFAGGVCLARDRQALGRWPHASVLLCGAAASAVVVVSLIAEGIGPAPRHVPLASAAVATSWLSVLGGLKWVDGLRALPLLAQRLAASTYAIYILHLPILGVAQLLVSRVVLNPVVAMVIVLIATLGLTLLLVEAVPRVTQRARGFGERWRTMPVAVWTSVVVVFGIAVRVVQYLRNPDVWHDEAALLVNVIERGYASLLTPLTYHEAAPPGFLWLERWMAVNVSDDQWVMRLLPLAASCLALVVFLPMTGVVTRRMAPVAVLLMASSFKLIGHSVEAKPYTLDVLLAAAAASAFVLTRTWSTARRAVLFALLAPWLIWASYPGVFVIGGIIGAIAVSAWSDARRGDRGAPIDRAAVGAGLALAALVLITGVSVALLIAGPVRAQRTAEIVDHWQWAFPAAANPLALAIWGARSVVGIADYCFRPFGGVLLLPIAAGLGALVRQGRYALVVLLVLPLLLAAGAGVAGYYPFSGSRVMVFALPALAVLAAEGLGTMLSWMPGRAVLLRATVLALAVLPPLVLCAREMVSPSPRPATAAATSFVLSARGPAEMVVAGNWEYRYYLRHLGTSFVPLDERPWPMGQDRLWWILHGDTAAARRARLTAFLGHSYDIVRAEDLYGVSVMELSARR